MTAHNQTAQHAAPKYRWAWRLGAAVSARHWPKRLAVGVASWAALGVITAWLDPRATGLVSMLGGVGAWLSAGVGLMATALVTHGSYRRHGVLAAAAAGLAMLAVTGAAAVLVDWSIVADILTLTTIVISAFVLFVYVLPCIIGDRRTDNLVRSSVRRSGDDYYGDYYDKDGYRIYPHGLG